MKIMKSCTARHRADHVPGQLYRYDDAAAWHLPAKFMVPIRLYGEIEVKTGTELGPEQNTVGCQIIVPFGTLIDRYIPSCYLKGVQSIFIWTDLYI